MIPLIERQAAVKAEHEKVLEQIAHVEDMIMTGQRQLAELGFRRARLDERYTVLEELIEEERLAAEAASERKAQTQEG